MLSTKIDVNNSFLIIDTEKYYNQFIKQLSFFLQTRKSSQYNESIACFDLTLPFKNYHINLIIQSSSSSSLRQKIRFFFPHRSRC